MKKYTILVTAVGAIVGYGIINTLRQTEYDLNIIGCDIFPDAVGQYFTDEFVVACPAADENYPEFLKSLIDSRNIDMVLFGIEQEISAVHHNLSIFSEYMPKLIINNKEIITVCDDKWLTYKWLMDHELSSYAIDSTIEGEYSDIAEEYGNTFLIKPRISRAGKGIEVVSSKEDFDFYRKKLEGNYMAQRIVGDTAHEYTVGIFGLGDGSSANEIYLRRTLSQEGATAKAWVAYDSGLITATKRITEALKPEGPTNYQFRKEGEDVYLLEINPRISSSTSIRSSFGYNEAKMCIEYYREDRVLTRVEVKRGREIRFISDMVFDS
jgi:carbamoyl-phosphate synthase large subunit